MLNASSVDTEAYEAADPTSWPFKERILFFGEFFVGVIKIIPNCFLIFLIWLKELIFGRKRKSIQEWTVLITGGANGIGRALCEEFSNAGCNVAVVDIDGYGAKVVANELKGKYGVKAVAYKVDVTDYQRLLYLKQKIEQDIGPVDILVNNAGIVSLISLREGVKEDIDKVIALNITSQFYTNRIFLKGMLERKRGHIVTISSMMAFYSSAGVCLYTATKHATNGLIKSLEQEIRLEKYGTSIKFTTVYPYFVATRKSLMDAFNLRIPAVNPHEVAKQTVEGVRKNYRAVYVPNWIGKQLKIFMSLPYKVQNLVRDQILREHEVKLFKFGVSHAEIV